MHEPLPQNVIKSKAEKVKSVRVVALCLPTSLDLNALTLFGNINELIPQLL